MLTNLYIYTFWIYRLDQYRREMLEVGLSLPIFIHTKFKNIGTRFPWKNFQPITYSVPT